MPRSRLEFNLVLKTSEPFGRPFRGEGKVHIVRAKIGQGLLRYFAEKYLSILLQTKIRGGQLSGKFKVDGKTVEFETIGSGDKETLINIAEKVIKEEGR